MVRNILTIGSFAKEKKTGVDQSNLDRRKAPDDSPVSNICVCW